MAKRRCNKLSGGQKQRVRFALALVSDPDLLLVLDEPTVAMDVQIRRQFWQAMREYTAPGWTVLFVTHYLEEAHEYADRVVLPRAGRAVHLRLRPTRRGGGVTSGPSNQTGPRIGSVCTGYGGLDLAVHAVLGGQLAWYADNDPAASRILAARFPGVANLGDLRTVDWHHVQPVDLLTRRVPLPGLFRVINYPDCWSPDARCQGPESL